MKKKRTMILIITLALTIVLIGTSYAYFSVMFNDNRSEENNTKMTKSKKTRQKAQRGESRLLPKGSPSRGACRV